MGVDGAAYKVQYRPVQANCAMAKPILSTGVLISPQPDQEGNKLGSMTGTRAISTTSRRKLSSSFFFLQCKAPNEIHAILTETLACFLPDRAKDLSAHLYTSCLSLEIRFLSAVREVLKVILTLHKPCSILSVQLALSSNVITVLIRVFLQSPHQTRQIYYT